MSLIDLLQIFEATMTDLLASLPAPKYESFKQAPREQSAQQSQPRVEIPPYGKREGYLPRSKEDFGDGGAFPELHIKQYPLDMGRPDAAGKMSKAVSTQVDSEGNIKYDVVLRQNMRKDMVVFSSYKDLAEKDVAADSLAKPGPEEEEKTAGSPSPCCFVLVLLSFCCVCRRNCASSLV